MEATMTAPATEASSLVNLYLIRGFELRHGDQVIPVPPSSQRLVAFVALRERAVRRCHVSGVLWLDAQEERANASLRSALWRTPSPGGCPLIKASSTHLWLNPEVDVDFRVSVPRVLSALNGDEASSRTVDALQDELALLADDLLPDWYEDWVLIERERFRQLRLHALEQISERLSDAGLYSQALQAGLAAVAAEPLRESGRRQVVSTHLREGNVSEALREYQAYARLLADELGVAPSAAMQDLILAAMPKEARYVTSG
jgi:DNA-binding SARP family transcriptional activator